MRRPGASAARAPRPARNVSTRRCGGREVVEASTGGVLTVVRRTQSRRLPPVLRGAAARGCGPERRRVRSRRVNSRRPAAHSWRVSRPCRPRAAVARAPLCSRRCGSSTRGEALPPEPPPPVAPPPGGAAARATAARATTRPAAVRRAAARAATAGGAAATRRATARRTAAARATARRTAAAGRATAARPAGPRTASSRAAAARPTIVRRHAWDLRHHGRHRDRNLDGRDRHRDLDGRHGHLHRRDRHLHRRDRRDLDRRDRRQLGPRRRGGRSRRRSPPITTLRTRKSGLRRTLFPEHDALQTRGRGAQASIRRFSSTPATATRGGTR